MTFVNFSWLGKCVDRPYIQCHSRVAPLQQIRKQTRFAFEPIFSHCLLLFYVFFAVPLPDDNRHLIQDFINLGSILPVFGLMDLISGLSMKDISTLGRIITNYLELVHSKLHSPCSNGDHYLICSKTSKHTAKQLSNLTKSKHDHMILFGKILFSFTYLFYKQARGFVFNL